MSIQPNIAYSVISYCPKHGAILQYPDDAGFVYTSANQKWLPREVPGDSQFKTGDIVSTGYWLYRQLGIAAAIVSRTRSFKYYKNKPPTKQIELLGLPLQWFAEEHFTA